MGLSITQVNAGGTALLLAYVPPGADVVLATQDTAADVAWGPASTVTYATGSIIPPATSIHLTNPATAPGFSIFVISNTGNHEVSAQVTTPR